MHDIHHVCPRTGRLCVTLGTHTSDEFVDIMQALVVIVSGAHALCIRGIASELRQRFEVCTRAQLALRQPSGQSLIGFLATHTHLTQRMHRHVPHSTSK